MKYPALGILSLALICEMTACTPGESGKNQMPRGVLDLRPRFEELTTDVPKGFSESAKWNQSKICPEGSILTPFTRYDYDAGQESHGFKHYFGRSCAIIESSETDVATRKLASVEPKSAERDLETAEVPPVTVIPHGPFIWWYETGRRMGMGSFDHGTLGLGALEYQPDGKLVATE